MDRELINQAVITLDKLDYTDKLQVHNRVFSLGTFDSPDLNEKLILISLVALVTRKMREKDPTATPLSILMKITGQVKDNSGFYQFLESLSIIVEDFSYGCTKFDTCGLTNSQDIINKIKEIINTWLPF